MLRWHGNLLRMTPCAASFAGARPSPYLNLRTPFTSKLMASRLIAGTGTVFTWAMRRARSAARGTCRPPIVTPQKLQFAFASCQDYEDGYYTAYEHMANDELDLVFHLGDYIYENAPTDGLVRKNVGKELESLDDYRLRYAQQKSDPLLQGMHARCPWIVTWDDHEVMDDYAGEFSKEPVIDPVKFLVRRAAAYQAYYETMPLRKESLPRGPNLQLYRKMSFGRLAEFLVLDTRQYRTDQPYAGEKHAIDDLAMRPKATILGGAQMQWLQIVL